MEKVERKPNTMYTLSLSYGKDSLACLGAIEKLGLPLDRIVHAEIWATQEISADLPPMVEFKAKADEIILKRYGIKVEHVSAITINGGVLTYEMKFYTRATSCRYGDHILGFPKQQGAWCNSKLKMEALARAAQGAGDANEVSYLGIAADEPERIERHEKKEDIMLPLVMAGWDEAYCRKWCEERDLLSPIYITATRGGCWFCHNQGVDQLRELRKNYPDLWALLMKWDLDSPITFKADGHTVHDYDERFRLEDEGVIDKDEPFYWRYLQQKQLRIQGI